MRRLLIAAAAVLILLAVVGFVLRQSLLQGELRPAVEARLSATLGQPVSIGRLGVSLFPRPSISGRDIRVGVEQTRAPALTIERVRIFPRLGSIMSSQIVVEEVRLDGFVVSVLHDDKGWHVPSAVPGPTSAEESGVAVERVRVEDARIRIFDRQAGGEIQERSSIDDIQADVVVQGLFIRLIPISGRIGDSEITGEARVDARDVRLEIAADRIADKDLPAFLHLLGSERPAFLRITQPASLSAAVRVNRSSGRLEGSGKLAAPQVELDSLRLTGFAAPFAIEGSRLRFDPATFALYNGMHRGTVTVALAEPPPAWTTDSQLSGVDAGAFLGAVSGRDQRIDGTASLRGSLQGRVGESLAATVNGRMRMELANGVIRDFPLLAHINRALRLAEQSGNDTQFERLSATLAIASGAAITDDLVLQAAHVRVEAAGRIGSDRSLALRGVAAVSRERSLSAIASIHELKGLRNTQGEVEIPLTISGSLDAPTFGLDVQAAIRKGITDELRRRIRRIIK
jgi:uncharacterized protein involved in outer membrane biogenesis